jgi:PAS domain S-box-containing protein
MLTNLQLLKTIGWPALDLTPMMSGGEPSAAADESIGQENVDIWMTMFDHMPCAIAIVDRHGQLVRANRMFCGLIECLPSEIKDHRLNELTIGFGIDGLDQSIPTTFCDLFAGDKNERLCAVSRKDGTKVWCRQTTIPVGGKSKQSNWIICYFDELRASVEALQLVVRTHSEFVQQQTMRSKTICPSLCE